MSVLCCDSDDQHALEIHVLHLLNASQMDELTQRELHGDHLCSYSVVRMGICHISHKDKLPVCVIVFSVAARHSVNGVGCISNVNLNQARLVLGLVTIFGGQTSSVFL